jgi:hypothetical protein
MSSNGNSSGAGDTEVSGYEAEITKQRRGTKKEINKGVEVSTYGDRKVKSNKGDFIQSGADTIEKNIKIDSITDFNTFKVIGNLLEKPLKAGSIKTRTFFSDKVLSKKGVTHDGMHYGKTTFENLSLKEQNEIYAGYISKRMSGETDAYGNVNTNYGKGDGGNQPIRKTEVQIESESETETKKADVAISEDEYKKRRGLIGSRSMFSRSGGRGFFDSTGSAIV